MKLAFVYLVEGRISGNDVVETTDELHFFVYAYRGAGLVMVASGYQRELAREAVDHKYKDHNVIVLRLVSRLLRTLWFAVPYQGECGSCTARQGYAVSSQKPEGL